MRTTLCLLFPLVLYFLAATEAWNVIPKGPGPLVPLQRQIFGRLRRMGFKKPQFNFNLKETLEKIRITEDFKNSDVMYMFDRTYPGKGFAPLTKLVKITDKVYETLDVNMTFAARYNRESPPLVNVEEGTLKGMLVSSKSGGFYFAFMGIPYAGKPKRWQKPQPKRPWSGIRDATVEGPSCWQRVDMLESIGGTEDCLYLNVATPSLTSKGLPVLVWIHGGAFKYGTGSMYLHGPGRIVRQGVIVVTFNYRLGVLGFLCTGTPEAPGNAGMKDTVFALKWIKRNIHRFGGDPDNITIYGVSSGASMVEYLMISPMSFGLFTRAIMQSSSSLNEWAFNKDPVNAAFQLGKNLDIITTDPRILVNRLSKIRGQDLVAAGEKLYNDASPSADNLLFVPCAEEHIPGEEPFITEYPEVILRSGNFYKVPIMQGFNSDEGILYLDRYSDLPRVNAILPYLIPVDLMTKATNAAVKREIVNKVREFYFGNEPISNRTASNFVALLGDVRFLYGFHRSSMIRLRRSDQPVYYSVFAYDSELGQFKQLADVPDGVSHADDLAYMFTFPYANNIQLTPTTKRVIKRQVAMLTNFVKYGNPTPALTQTTPITWYPIRSLETLDYLVIKDTIEMQQNPFIKRLEFWDNLYRLYCDFEEY